MKKNIFISYRREDTEGFARGLFQSLMGAFGEDSVFMDVEAISLGTDFIDAIDKSLAGCGALLVLIGKDWISCTDANGQRRINDPQDFVRMEVAKALERNVRVIPVLVKGAGMPAAEELPAELKTLTRRQALELRHARWNQDVDQLITALSELLGITPLNRKPSMPPPPAPRPKRSGWRMVVGAGVAAAVVVLGLVGYSLMTHISTPMDAGQSRVPNEAVVDPDASPAPVNVGPSANPETAVKPDRSVRPETTPNTQKTINLSGMWVDDDGVNVQISQQGGQVVSQAYNPLTGLAINAVWRVSGRQVAFNWASNTGNQGHGQGTIAADGNTLDYRYIDQVTGEQGYGRLYRVLQ
jgi:hypothetical protein